MKIFIILLFQSSPPSQGGRYHCKKFSESEVTKCFNPRPPRKGGATAPLTVVTIMVNGFQSSPPSQGGRYLGPTYHRLYFQRVSILAPLARGALPGDNCVSTLSGASFNPRPPRKGGATIIIVHLMI